jgi:hypothetical protein
MECEADQLEVVLSVPTNPEVEFVGCGIRVRYYWDSDRAYVIIYNEESKCEADFGHSQDCDLNYCVTCLSTTVKERGIRVTTEFFVSYVRVKIYCVCADDDAIPLSALPLAIDEHQTLLTQF